MKERPIIPDKARKVIPLLGSPNEGEALGACRALGRVLAGSGLDFSDLAAAIPFAESDAPGRAQTDVPSRPDPRAAAQPAGPFRAPAPAWEDWRGEWARRFRRPRAFTPRQEAQQERMTAFCRAHASRLGPRERAFVGSLRSRLDGLTILQAEWLTDICARLEWEDARLWQ